MPKTSARKKSVLQDIADALNPVMGAQTPKQLASHVRQAITTTFRGPTDASGSRIIARCEAKQITVPYDHALDGAENHAAAAIRLMDVLGWSSRDRLVMGGTKDGYAFVQVPKI